MKLGYYFEVKRPRVKAPTSLHNSDKPVLSFRTDVGTGSTNSLKHAESFFVNVAYRNGGSTIGTISPNPIVDKDMKA